MFVIKLIKNNYRMKSRLRILALLFFSIILTIFSTAQKTAIHQEPVKTYRMGLELLNKQKYSAAQQKFDELIKNDGYGNYGIKSNAEYYGAICAFELFNRDAEFKLSSFIHNNPTHTRVKHAYFQLGKFEYRNRKYRAAIKNFTKTDVFELDNDELAEYHFKMGYSHFKLKKNELAKESFYEVKDKNSKYSSPATYYYSHIAYDEGNYETSLKGFQKLSTDANFRSIVPFYIIQIYFIQEKYNKLLEIAPPLLETASAKRIPEINRMIGESYFRTSEYKESIPFLKKYHESSNKKISRADKYQLGFAFYMTNDYKEALENLKQVADSRDSLAQNAHFIMADCYLKSDQRKFAANAFYSAYKLPFDPEIKENSLFNYAKLSYELGYDPYSEAIKAMKNYIQKYPDSPRKDEAYKYLVDIAINSNNYKDALVAIQSIDYQKEGYEGKYQLINFNRAVELFNQKHYDEAIKRFKEAARITADKSIAAESIYWVAESFFRKPDYWAAKKYYKEFQVSAGAFDSPVYDMANYNLGYACFKKKEYDEAILSFRKFVTKSKDNSSQFVSDAYLRIADCYFIRKKYQEAILWYDKAIALKVVDTDYGLFQKALSLGVLLKYEEKIATLEKLIKDYPESPFVDDAAFEIGSTYLVLLDYEKSLIYFKKVNKDYPGSSYVIKSRLQTGLIYYNLNENQLALETFKKVVEDFPGTPASKEALVSIRNIYVDLNKVDDFFVYVQGLSFADVTTAQQDSITYIAAENQYLNSSCESSVESFASYLKKFPSGSYIANACYYKAECELKTNQLVDALADYQYVIRLPKSKFTEKALVKAAY